jgi:hypothetical protein
MTDVIKLAKKCGFEIIGDRVTTHNLPFYIENNLQEFYEAAIDEFKARLGKPVAWRLPDHVVTGRYFVFADYDNAKACSMRINEKITPLYAIQTKDLI